MIVNINFQQGVRIFGCGRTAVRFYLNYKSRLNVHYAISNNQKEVFFSPELGINYEVKRPVVKEEGKEGLIIICCEAYQQVAEQLILLGYEPYRDFIDYKMASVLLDKKKIVLLYGFCHLRAIKDCLMEVSSFCEEYVAFYFPNYLYLNTYQVEGLQFCIEQCSVYIYGMEIMPESHRKNEAILQRLKKNVQVMKLPGFYFGGYFPQRERKYNAMNAYAVKCENYNYTPFSYGDSWLNECIDKGMDATAVIEFLETDTVFRKEELLRYLENEWGRLRFQERASEFKIVDYIEKNYRKKRLFRNEMHMENCIIYEYVYQILEHLNLKKKVLHIERPLFQCSQHLIYPEVERVLGLEWNVWEESLDLYTYSGWKKCTMKEYIQYYMETCNSVRILKEQSFLP